MARPKHCSSPSCRCACHPRPRWCVRDGLYHTRAHGTVQRYRCRYCGRRLSAQTESVYYYSKRRLDLAEIQSRLRGGSSMRDIARELGCSRTAIATAVMRLGRQAMAAHLQSVIGLEHSGTLCFDGLVSAVTGRDYPSQITTLADSRQELLLAMTHCVTRRGGRQTEAQRRRAAARRWRPPKGGLGASISLLLREMSRFSGAGPVCLDIDEHPVYTDRIARDIVLSRRLKDRTLTVRRTPGSAPRTGSNPLSVVNYLDRMVRHRMKEHTRESIALARNASMQMHRMWVFAWDHNARQPMRVRSGSTVCRLEQAGLSRRALDRIKRQYFTRRLDLFGLPMPESMVQVWRSTLVTPPVRWRKGLSRPGPVIPRFARRDLDRAYLHGQ